MDCLVDVAVPFRVSASFHYLAPSEVVESLSLGSIIQVPFKNRLTHAFVLGFPSETSIERKRLKAIESVLVTEPLFDESMLKFLKWVSDYYCHPLGEVISAAIPKQYLKISTAKRKKPVALDDPEASRGLLSDSAAFRPTLNEEQAFAVARMLDPEDKRPVLLHGVTGSGKTEVYMTVLEKVLQAGKGAIVLVPEIALTPQLLGRFSARFSDQVAVLHSDLTPKERYIQWERLRLGLSRVVVGARSAIFAPVKNLGLIVVDEEHEGSFKQEDSFHYHGRDVAVVRGSMQGAKVVLGTATPSLESYANAESGKYLYVTLKNRVENRPMPKTTFIDLRDKTQWVAPKIPYLTHALVDRVAETLRSGNQAMLFLNRLGYAHFLFCSDCGHTWRCRQCDVTLTYYQSPPLLKCHYCGITRTPPSTCEACHGVNLETMGAGTEQVEKEIKKLLPKARIARMDRSVVKTRHDLESLLKSIAAREVDIVIGTQMIAKGHDFPGVALVGILTADASLNLPDFRANERTFQAITQVSGRAGRAGVAGEVVLQTINPDHPVLQAAATNRPMDFYRLELGARREHQFPPFHRMAMVRLQHRRQPMVEAFAEALAGFTRDRIGRAKWRVSIIGPAEAPLSKLKNLYRFQMLVKAEAVKELQQCLRLMQDQVAACKTPVRVDFDVDPISAL